MLTSAAVLEARFTVTKFREGYDQDEVSAFLQRASEALAAWEGGTGSTGMTGDDVVRQKFTPTKFDNGFDQDEVDMLLDRVVGALREHAAAPPTVAFTLPVAEAAPVAPVASAAPVAEPAPAKPADLVRSSSLADMTFTTTRLRSGYSIAGVDGFLAAARTLIASYESTGEAGDAAPFGSADVVNVRFTTTKWRRGYEQNEVGDVLTRVIATLAYYEKVAAAR